MLFMEKKMAEKLVEEIPEAAGMLDNGIPDGEYYGQTVWDGEKLVTEEDWAEKNGGIRNGISK